MYFKSVRFLHKCDQVFAMPFLIFTLACFWVPSWGENASENRQRNVRQTAEFVINRNCDYNGRDLSNERKNSIDECIVQCQATLRCTHVTYNGNNKRCYLKHASTKEQVLATNKAANNAWCAYFSNEERFETGTTANSILQNFIVNQNCDYYGRDLSNVRKDSIDECVLQCQATLKCTHVTYTGNNKRCYLKHASTKEQVSATNRTLNNAWCAYFSNERRSETVTTENPIFQNFRIDEKCDYVGLDLFNIRKASVGECVAQCYETLRCTHITYDNNKKQCFVKHASTKEETAATRKASDNAWCAHITTEERFEPTTTTTSTTTAMTTENPNLRHFIISRDCEYDGLDLFNVEKESVKDCVNQCYKTKRCTHITYDDSSKDCFVKHASTKEHVQQTHKTNDNSWCAYYVDEDRFEAPTTTTELPSTTTEDSILAQFVIRENYGCSSMKVYATAVSSTKECASKCLENPSCTHFTFVRWPDERAPACYMERAKNKEAIISKMFQDSAYPENVWWCGYVKDDSRYNP